MELMLSCQSWNAGYVRHPVLHVLTLPRSALPVQMRQCCITTSAFSSAQKVVTHLMERACHATILASCAQDPSLVCPAVMDTSQAIRSVYLRKVPLSLNLVCPNGSYADPPSQACQPCSSECLTCQYSPTTCTSCNTSLNLTLDFLSNRCVAVCPNGLFNSVPSGAKCQPCSAVCLTCSTLASNCTSCSSTILQNGTCVSSCTEGYYYSNRTCLACDSRCSICSSSIKCQTCSIGYFMNSSISGAVPCISLCSDGYYADTTVRMCIGCSPPCRTCLNSLQCLSCLSGWLFSTSCAFSCPTGTYSDDSTGSCLQCSQKCLSCSLAKDRCTSCADELLLSNYSCIVSCQSGSYLDVASSSCMPCQLPCKTCTGSAVQCLSCLIKFLTKSHTCDDTCPQGSFPNSSTLTCDQCTSPCLSCSSANQCTTCISQYFLEPDLSCVKQCENTEYGSNGLCIPCLFPCLTCTSSSECLSCQTGSLNNGTCSSECNVGGYMTFSQTLNSSVCLSCASQCRLCISTATYCLHCSDHSAFSLNGSCYLSN